MGAPIWTKFGSLMQKNMQITANWSTSKPEVEFQYGGHLYFESRSSHISAANWDIWTKFGLLIDLDFMKAVTSTNTKPEVVYSGSGRHLEKWIWRHISAVSASIWTSYRFIKMAAAAAQYYFWFRIFARLTWFLASDGIPGTSLQRKLFLRKWWNVATALILVEIALSTNTNIY